MADTFTSTLDLSPWFQTLKRVETASNSTIPNAFAATIAAKAAPYFNDAIRIEYLAAQGIQFSIPMQQLKRRHGKGLAKAQRYLAPGKRTGQQLEAMAVKLLEDAFANTTGKPAPLSQSTGK